MMRANSIAAVRRGVVAGAAGGLAEVAWISAYAAATGVSAAPLARGVTTAAGVGALLPENPVVLGVLTHMAIAIALGIALSFAWRGVAARVMRTPYAFSLGALALVWAMNFFVILPVVSPDFVQLVPYPVSLASKLLFGLAAALVLQRRAEVTAKAAA